MHIFIDESGTFSSPGTAAVSAVGALVVRNRKLPYLLKRRAGLRPSLPQEKSEVKGRLLSKQQVGQVVSLLKNKGALFEVVTTDMSLNTEWHLTEGADYSHFDRSFRPSRISFKKASSPTATRMKALTKKLCQRASAFHRKPSRGWNLSTYSQTPSVAA